MLDSLSSMVYTPPMQTSPMPVTFRLHELLAERSPAIGQSELARKAKVSFVTVNAIANNRTKRVDLETLDKLCGALAKMLGRRVAPGELLDHGPSKRKRG